MKQVVLIIVLALIFAIPVSAEEIVAPEVTGDAASLMPQEAGNFALDLMSILKTALINLRPEFVESFRISIAIFAVVLLCSILQIWKGQGTHASEIILIVSITCILLENTNSLIHLGTDTIFQMSEYGKLLLPVMTTALAAQGGTVSSAALYTGTAFFDAILSAAISNFLIPMIYIFVALAVVSAATKESLIHQLLQSIKWLMTWCLKIILYIFTGYISITGVISGATDQTALKTAKLAISSAIPVVGNILSDASEAVLVGAGTVKNAAGIYGVLAISAIFIGPFLKIGVQYGFLKLTAAACSVISDEKSTDILGYFSDAMGLLLAMTGAVCLMQLISTICFLKGLA